MVNIQMFVIRTFFLFLKVIMYRKEDWPAKGHGFDLHIKTICGILYFLSVVCVNAHARAYWITLNVL